MTDQLAPQEDSHAGLEAIIQCAQGEVGSLNPLCESVNTNFKHESSLNQGHRTQSSGFMKRPPGGVSLDAAVHIPE